MFLFVHPDSLNYRAPDEDNGGPKRRMVGGTMSSATRRLLSQHKRCRSVDWANDGQPPTTVKQPVPNPVIGDAELIIPLHSTSKRNSVNRKTRSSNTDPPKPQKEILHKTSNSGELSISIPELLDDKDLVVASSFSPPSAFEDLRDNDTIQEQQIALGNDRNAQRIMNLIHEKQPIVTQQRVEHQQPNIPLVFDKIPIQKQVQQESALKYLILHGKAQRESTFIHRQVNVVVFVPHREGGVHLVKLTLSEKATGVEMIQTALEHYTRETGKQPISTQYILRAAESDGSVDPDFPSMDRNTTLQKLGFKSFVLVPDNKPLMRINSPSAEEDLHTLIYEKSQIENRLFLQDIWLEVLTDFDVTGAIVPIAPDMLIRDIIKGVCHHYDFHDQDRYMLRFRMNDGRLLPIPESIKLLTCKFLKYNKLLLSQVKTKNVSIPTKEEQSMFELLLPSNPINYREYSVIKINNFGRRQERILGIDSNKIYNKMPHMVTTFLGLPARTRVPERPVSSLVTVITEPDKPLKFTTVFDDETLYWEAQTVVEAQEIVTTLRNMLKFYEQDRRYKQITADNTKNSNKLLSRLSVRFLTTQFGITHQAPSTSSITSQPNTMNIPTFVRHATVTDTKNDITRKM